MELIIGGQTIELESLGDSIDDKFTKLHAAYLGRDTFNWKKFVEAAHDFFDDHPDPAWDMHDKYFTNFTVIWRSYLNARDYDRAEEIWRRAMSTALTWESDHPENRIHKGTPYYFWGVTALQKGDLDKGYALMHQAVDEDSKSQGKAFPDTPAFAFASLNYAEPEQAFREWPYRQMRYMDSRQNNYSARYSRQFHLEHFKDHFLLSPPSVDIGFLFAYSVARLMQLSDLPDHALASGFAAQLEANILFDLALVIDGTIKSKNPTKWKFIHHAEFLLAQFNEFLTEDQLREINQAFNNDFDAALSDILDGQLAITGISSLSLAQADVALAYGMRNRGAHDVTAAPTVWTRFSEIEQALFNVLYLAVDILYP